MKNLQDLLAEYKKGKWNPKDYLWKYEIFQEDQYSLYIINKKDKSDYLAFDGGQTLGMMKKIGRLFNVQVRELNKKKDLKK